MSYLGLGYSSSLEIYSPVKCFTQQTKKGRFVSPQREVSTFSLGTQSVNIHQRLVCCSDTSAPGVFEDIVTRTPVRAVVSL
jgi:hypothetical protein